MSPKSGDGPSGGSGATCSISVLAVVVISRGFVCRRVRGEVVAAARTRPGRRRLGRLHRRGAQRQRSRISTRRSTSSTCGSTASACRARRCRPPARTRSRCPSRGSPTRSRSSTRSGRRRACTSGRCSASPIPRASRRDRRRTTCRRGVEPIPACTASSQLTQANLAVTPNSSVPGLLVQQRPTGLPVRRVPLDQRRQARLRDEHGAPPGPRRQRQRQRGRALRARAGADDGPLHRPAPPPRRTRPASGWSTTR